VTISDSHTDTRNRENTMKMMKALARLLVLTLSLATAIAQADVLLDVNGALVAGDPTQLGRLSRNGVLQDWAGTEPFPGAVNPAVTYHYHTHTVNVGITPYIQIEFDSATPNTFVAAYVTSYNPNSAGAPNYGFDTNWLGDAGSSGNFFGIDPRYFNVIAPLNSTLVVVVLETAVAGLNQPYRLMVEGFTDRNFTSLAVTSTTIASSLNPSTLGASVTFTASVTGVAPTGTVDFKDGGVSIPGCNAQPLGGAGNTRTATCTTSALTGGAHSIGAVYSGDGVNATSTSANMSQVVNVPGGTLVCNPNPAQELATVTCVLTVSGVSPTGYVNFLDGAATIAGCGGVPLAGVGNTKTATCTTSALSVGSHSVSGVYTGDRANPGGASAPVTEVITPRPATTTALGSSLNPSTNTGPAPIFTATVTGASPTGTVLFKDGAATIAGCAAKPVSGGTATCTAYSLAPGAHNITAVYSGDLNNAGSTSPPLVQTVTCTGRGCPPT
jgi:hypothetical protein